MDAMEVEKKYYRDQFVEEAKQIPPEALTTEENKLRQKFIDGEELTDDEYEDVTALLKEFRGVLEKYQPKKTLDQLDENINIIKSAQDLINAIEEDKTLTVDFPIKGKIHRVVFDVLPVSDSRAVKSMEHHMALFKSFTPEEKQKLIQLSSKPKLSDRERKVKENLEERVMKRVTEEESDKMVEFLAHTLRLPGAEQSLEERKAFWRKLHYGYRFRIFIKVEEKMGLLEDQSNKLFPFD